MADLNELVEAVRMAPGLLAKRDLAIVARLAAEIDGDDAALVAHGDGYMVLCGEGHLAPFLLEDPFAAGAAAVVTSVSDVRAMGGRPLGVVDMLVAPDRAHAETVLDGIAWASDKLSVPSWAGTSRSGAAPSLAASCTGFARRRCRRRGSARRRPDRRIRPTASTQAEARPFFTALHDRAPALLRTDGEALVEVAERGCMPCRSRRLDARDRRLAPADDRGAGGARRSASAPSAAGRDMPLERWLLTFPSFGSCSPPRRARRRGGRRLHAARPGVRSVLRSSTTPGSCGSRRTAGGPRPGPRGDPAHRPQRSERDPHRLVHDAV